MLRLERKNAGHGVTALSETGVTGLGPTGGQSEACVKSSYCKFNVEGEGLAVGDLIFVSPECGLPREDSNVLGATFEGRTVALLENTGGKLEADFQYNLKGMVPAKAYSICWRRQLPQPTPFWRD